MYRFVTAIAIASFLAGCGGESGTYVDDKDNYERAFQSKCPTNVQVIHSFFSKSPHFTEEREFYFQLRPSTDANILKWLVAGTNMVSSTDGLKRVPYYYNLRGSRPKWFVQDGLTNYDIWHHTKGAYIVLRNRHTSEIFVYESFGM